MTIDAPPRPPDRKTQDLEALIEEARQRARRRRLLYFASGLLVALGVALAIGLYLGVSRSGRTTVSPPVRDQAGPVGNGALVFVAPGPSHGFGVDNSDLYAVGSSGGSRRALTRTAGAEQEVAWTEDGSRVVFMREYTTGGTNGSVRYQAGVFTMPVGGPAQLIRRCATMCDARDFAWSPDDRRIAFVNQAGVMTMDADGSNTHVVCDESRCGQGLAGPQWSPDGARLVFSNQGVIAFPGLGILPSGIWVANVDGSGVHKATQPRCRPGHAPLVGCFFDSAPSWSPDGSMIAFSRLDQRLRSNTSLTSLEAVRPDGSHLHAIATCKGYRCNQVMAPVWSPGGTRIAFARSAERGPAIVLVTPSDHATTIPACAGSRCVTPTDVVWSPDGRSLAFASSTNPAPAWVIRANGRNMHSVAADVLCCLAWLPRGAVPVPATRLRNTHPPLAPALRGTLAFASDKAKAGSAPDEIYELDPQTAGVRALTRGPQINSQPAWSPDGRRIAFAGSRLGHNTNVFVADRDGSGEHAITHSASGATEPAWAPDGRKIAVVTDNGIDIIDSNGGALRTVVAGNDRDPAWSPDGRLIAFSRSFQGGSALYTVHPDGTGLRRVTELPGNQDSPAWSPDGRRIAFVWTNAGSGLYLVDPNGGGLRRVTADPIQPGRPAWSPDGRYLAFTTGYTWQSSIISVAAVATGDVTRLVTINGEASDPTWTRRP